MRLVCFGKKRWGKFTPMYKLVEGEKVLGVKAVSDRKTSDEMSAVAKAVLAAVDLVGKVIYADERGEFTLVFETIHTQTSSDPLHHHILKDNLRWLMD